MKRIISILMVLAVCFSLFCVQVQADEEFSASSKDFVANLTVGWNLGNTFENWKSTWTVGNVTPTAQETSTGNPVTTQKLIDAVANQGYKAVRIPITWACQMQYSEAIGVAVPVADFITRIKEVVGYCQKDNLYVIINMHHDDNASSWLSISGNDSQFNAVKKRYQAYWKAIATEFRDYGEKLVFEGMNEITATNAFDGCSTASGKCWWGHNQAVFDRMNELYSIFINTVRATGGNNEKRYLMIPTYGAQWYSHQIDNVKVPNNDNHIILDIHWYSSAKTVSEVQGYFMHAAEYCYERNWGCVFGECGITVGSQDTAGETWANNFVATAKSQGITCFVWDDGGNYATISRNNCDWLCPAYINSMVNNAYVCRGTCGTGLEWSMSINEGVLNISGNGAMTSFASDNKAPWYNNRDSIREITFSSGVTSISPYAFKNYTSLKNVSFANSITSIGDYAFYGCLELTSVSLPQNLSEIGNYSFFECRKLATLGDAKNLKTIGAFAFYNCYTLSKFIASNSLTNINEYAFARCYSLTGEISFPTTLKYIGANAFENCALTKVEFLGADSEIARYSFVGCCSLTIKSYRNTSPYLYATNSRMKYELINSNATNLYFLNGSASVDVGKAITLGFTIMPSYTSDTCSFSSSDESIAKVDSNGVVTGVSAGTARITIKSSNGLSDDCIVSVNGVSQLSIATLNYSSKTLKTGKSFTLKSYGSSKKSVTSSSKKIAVVNKSGKVTAKKKGTCYITLTTKSGKKLKCKVKVK